MVEPPLGVRVPDRGWRRRRRRNPLVLGLVVVAGVVGIGSLWYYVFNPIFTDADTWVGRERTYRRLIRQTVSGADDGLPAAPDLPPWPPPLDDAQLRILACADSQVARDVRYTPGYHKMPFPWGDIPAHLATAPDLVVRCLRATGLDLQQLIHIDRVREPSRYPLKIWANRKPDTAIDHRRLPNLYTFIKAYLPQLPVYTDSADKLAAFAPGDLVFWVAPGGGDYPGLVGLVTDRRTADGAPLTVTLLREERRISDHHRVDAWQVFAHFRVDPDALLQKFLETNVDARLAPSLEAP
jgi:hypothetical protein